MSGRVAKASIEDEDLLAALEALEEEHGSMADAVRHAIRTASSDDGTDTTTAHGLPKAARDGYAALREHANVGERLALDAAEGIVAQRVQLRKSTVRSTVIRKLHAAGWISVHTGIQSVGVIIRDRTASDGGYDDNAVVARSTESADNVETIEEAEAELDKLANATPATGGDA